MSDFDTSAFFGGVGKGAGGFGANRGLILVSTQLDTSGIVRDARGWYTSRQNEAAVIGERLSIELAASVAGAAKSRALRPRVSTGRLQAALLDRRNRFAAKEGYGVGRPEFLDKSEAKYWRQIDQGFSGHVGREIRGIFGNRATNVYKTAASGPYMVPGGQFTAIGAGAPIGKLYPLGKKSAYRLLANAKRSGRLRGRPRVESTIEQPIDPQRYFKRGWEDFGARAQTTTAIKASLKGSLPPPR